MRLFTVIRRVDGKDVVTVGSKEEVMPVLADAQGRCLDYFFAEAQPGHWLSLLEAWNEEDMIICMRSEPMEG